MNPRKATEAELLRRWRGSESAEERRAILGRILDPYLGRIARWALRFSRDPEEAREVAQDALLAVCSHLDRFRGESRFSTWLYVLVRNHALKRAQRAAGKREMSDEALQRLPADGDPARSYEHSDHVKKAQELIASTLTPLEARVFLLHFGLEVPLATLDRQLELTNPSGARAYLVSAKRKLRRVLERRGQTAETRGEGASLPMRRTNEPLP